MIGIPARAAWLFSTLVAAAVDIGGHRFLANHIAAAGGDLTNKIEMGFRALVRQTKSGDSGASMDPTTGQTCGIQVLAAILRLWSNC